MGGCEYGLALGLSIGALFSAVLPTVDGPVLSNHRLGETNNELNRAALLISWIGLKQIKHLANQLT